MYKYIAAALFIFGLANPSFAQLPCGTIAPQAVTANFNVVNDFGLTPDTVKVHFSLTSGGPYTSIKTFAFPSPEPDGSYNITASSSAFTNDVDFYVAVSATSSAGAGPVTTDILVPASISGTCPPLLQLNSVTPVP